DDAAVGLAFQDRQSVLGRAGDAHVPVQALQDFDQILRQIWVIFDDQQPAFGHFREPYETSWGWASVYGAAAAGSAGVSRSGTHSRNTAPPGEASRSISAPCAHSIRRDGASPTPVAPGLGVNEA